MTLYSLSVKQAESLAAHLGTVLTGDALYDAIATLDQACLLAAHKPIPPEDREHLRAIAEVATVLDELLQVKRPLFAVGAVDFYQLHGMLTTVAFTAGKEAELHTKRTRGPRTKPGRDVIIATAYGIYPEGTAKKTADTGHFEVTVKMLLGFVGQDVGDVHGLISDALKRTPESRLPSPLLPRPIDPIFTEANGLDLAEKLRLYRGIVRMIAEPKA